MRFTNSPYEDFMKEKSYFKGVFRGQMLTAYPRYFRI